MLQFGKVYEASMKEVHEDCRNGRSIMYGRDQERL
jgi:hypothetical protein